MLRTLALSLILAAPAFAEEGQGSTPTLAWQSAAPVRVVTSWVVEQRAAKDRAWSGVVRGTWSPVGADGIAQSDVTSVYALPRGDAQALSVEEVLAAAWTVSAAMPEPEPEVEPEVPAAPEEAMPAEDGEMAPDAPDAVPAAPAPAPEAPAPEAAAAVSPGDPLVAFVRLDDGELLAHTLGAFAGSAWAVGQSRTEQTDDLVITRTLKARGRCPDGGPGTSCLTLHTLALSDGASADGELATGQSRVEAAWVVDAATMWPHGGRIVRERAVGGADAPLRSRGVVVLQVQPAAPPAPLP